MSVDWQFLVTLNEQLRALKDPVAIQEAAVRLIGQHLHASRVIYAQVENDEFIVNQSYSDGVALFPRRARDGGRAHQGGGAGSRRLRFR
jgi:hypothetical protein